MVVDSTTPASAAAVAFDDSCATNRACAIADASCRAALLALAPRAGIRRGSTYRANNPATSSVSTGVLAVAALLSLPLPLFSLML